MSDFTYEFENHQAKLEKYEWDNTWLEQTSDAVKPRVLYIGDSISGGIRLQAQNNPNNKLVVFDEIPELNEFAIILLVH